MDHWVRVRGDVKMTAAETSGFLQPPVKLMLNGLALEIIRTVSNGMCQHTMSMINKILHSRWPIMIFLVT